jgi:energy-coupling factor transport system ATP-binding protein
LGLVFQNPDNQFVGSTVRDDIAFGLENRQVPQKEMEGIIQKVSQEVGMSAFLDSAPENLSGGQKQRVAIAGILAMKPDLIIYDEATSMLDPLGKKDVLDLTFKLREENPSLTVFSITHDVEEAAKADEVLGLNEGKLILQGFPKRSL